MSSARSVGIVEFLYMGGLCERSMPNEELLKILRDPGRRHRWNQERDVSTRIDFRGVDLSGTDLKNANLSNIDFKGANLSHAILHGADLSQSNLARAILKAADFCKANLNNAILEGAILEGARFIGANAISAVFSGATFGPSNDLQTLHAPQANFNRAKFLGSNMELVNLKNSILTDATFEDVRLFQANLNSADLNRSRFFRCNAGSSDFRGALLNDVELTSCDLSKSMFSGVTNATEVDFDSCNLNGATFENSNLVRASFFGCQIKDTVFHNSGLTLADFSYVQANARTTFVGATVEGMTIERHTLESMKEYGNLTPGDRMRMNIIDGVAILRNSYSGFWQWVHLSALVLFLYPYIWFVVSNWAKSQFITTGAGIATSITLLEALGRFIVSGGEDWKSGWSVSFWPFSAFIFASCYNIIRAILLWKTKQLELHEQASGLPALFSLDGKWRVMYWIGHYGFAFNALVVTYHTYHFLQKRIPIT